MEGPIAAYLEGLHAETLKIAGGEIAAYIPELAKADPGRLGISIATLDGETYAAGDADVEFTIQSVSKPFLYGLALEELGREAVLRHVGVEPTGDAFNSIVMDEANNRPFNPMVNAGAIAVSALVKGATYRKKRQAVLDLFARFAGRKLAIDEEVYLSERETGDRNRAIAAHMAQAGMLDGGVTEILDLYFSQCSVLVTTRDLAIMAATLANGGVNPITRERALAEEYVHDVLTVMNSCGMYNYAGQWSYEVGVPAKSGVAGSIAAVIPGQVGIAAYSPPLDRFGNSVRAIAACKRIAADFNLHIFRTWPSSGGVIRAEAFGNNVRSKRRRTAREREILTREGGRIGIVEAQGALFFGSAERLVRRIGELLSWLDFLVVDMRRVASADRAALDLLSRRLKETANGRLLFAQATPEGPLASLRAQAESAFFTDRDAALEWCENRLVAEEPAPHGPTPWALKNIELFQDLSGEDLRALESLARPFAFKAGQSILREGEEGRLFFAIAQGAASVSLRLPDGARSVRVATVGAGGVVGEMAMLDGGPRSADVIADEPVVAYGFSIQELTALGEERPLLLTAIYRSLARDLAERLRAANGEIRSLEH